ncbi:MAG: hypothetical protein ACOY6N_03040 [Pseudomonadota bacterium]
MLAAVKETKGSALFALYFTLTGQAVEKLPRQVIRGVAWRWQPSLRTNRHVSRPSHAMVSWQGFKAALAERR